MTKAVIWNPTDPSRLFYQTRQRRPMLDRAEGVYLWDRNGKRYLDGSSGAMVSNIGHSNPRVLEAMRKQMERSTFGYRLHFENEPAEHLAAQIAASVSRGPRPGVFCLGRFRGDGKLYQARQAIRLVQRTAIALAGHFARPFLPWLDPRRAGRHRLPAAHRPVLTDDAADAQDTGAPLLPRPGRR